MKYSLYFTKGQDLGLIELYLESQNGLSVRKYCFESSIERISDVPGMTRLFGKLPVYDESRYHLYPIILNGVEVGNYEIIQDHEKFIKVRFDNSGMLRGEWILRNLSSGEVLLWKPIPEGFSCPAKSVITSGKESGVMSVEQMYSSFELATHDDNTFEGIAVATGVWTGMDRNTTLFSDSLIQMLGEKMIAKKSSLMVDRNHNLLNDGEISSVEIVDDKRIKYIYVKGSSKNPIPRGSSLSMIMKSDLLWDNVLNVYVLVNAEPIGVSVLTAGKSACTICRIAI